MAEIIKDGTGSGNTAKVDSTNRLSTKSLQITTALHTALIGDAFCVSSGIITITNATLNGILYIKSCECIDLVLKTIFLDFGDTTTSTELSGELTFHFGPTGGTLVCCTPTNAGIINERIGDSQAFCGSVFKAGGVSETITGGSTTVFPINSTNFGYEFNEEIIIPKGQAFGVSYQAPAANSGQPVEVGFKILRAVVNGD